MLRIYDLASYNGPVVQLVERLICNEEVSGSSPLGSTLEGWSRFILRGSPRRAVKAA